jgi:hypothetical protein
MKVRAGGAPTRPLPLWERVGVRERSGARRPFIVGGGSPRPMIVSRGLPRSGPPVGISVEWNKHSGSGRGTASLVSGSRESIGSFWEPPGRPPVHAPSWCLSSRNAQNGGNYRSSSNQGRPNPRDPVGTRYAEIKRLGHCARSVHGADDPVVDLLASSYTHDDRLERVRDRG